MLVPDLLYEHRVERESENGGKREKEGEREGERGKEKGGRKRKDKRKEKKKEKRGRRKERKRRKGEEMKTITGLGSISPADGMSRGCGCSWLLATSGPTLVLQT